ncbi:hypothetical protein D3C79_934030 [compost metagenome]
MNDHGRALTQPQRKSATLDTLRQIDVKRFVLTIARPKAVQAWQLVVFEHWRCSKREMPPTLRDHIGVQMPRTN